MHHIISQVQVHRGGKNFLHMHPNENEITWENFKEGFCGAHIPKRVMKIKKKEFDELKQTAMTVLEYNSQFTLLSRYANEERMTESKKMEKFLEGLAPALKCQLVVHTFPDFKTLVDKAITLVPLAFAEIFQATSLIFQSNGLIHQCFKI